jgi:hypothetical protein
VVDKLAQNIILMEEFQIVLGVHSFGVIKVPLLPKALGAPY